MPRPLEVSIAVVALVLLSPVLLVAALLVRLSSSGPCLYRQVRVGEGGEPFVLLKFRTMVTDADGLGRLTVGNDDPRTTWIGRHLRRFKIDELPQLLNVIRGEMALVGPRPEVPEYIDRDRPDQVEALRSRPGMTDPASLAFRSESELLAGRTDPDRYYREVLLPAKLRLSTDYLRTRNTLSDLRILCRSAATLIGIRTDPPSLPAEPTTYRRNVEAGS